MNKAKEIFGKNALLVVLLLVMLLFEALIRSAGRGSLFSPSNLTNLIGQNGYVVILATGMLLCILTGGNIDLSVGSMVILVGAIGGVMLVNWGWNPYLCLLLCLLSGTALGAWQAFWIAYVNIPPFVVTLAGMLVFRGLALVILDSKNIGPIPDAVKSLFNNFIPNSDSVALIQNVSLIIAALICVALVTIQAVSRARKQNKGYTVENIWWMFARLVIVGAIVVFVFSRFGQHKGIPFLLVLLGVIVLAYSYFTQNTIPGRYLYAMGGNAKAARLSGVNTKKMLFFAYTNMGFLSAVAALAVVARFNQASTQAGMGYELDAIGSCFIGGASAYGGIGTVGGAVIGAVFMGVLNMGMSILGANQNLQRVIKGMVLLAAVIFDVLSKNRKQVS